MVQMNSWFGFAPKYLYALLLACLAVVLQCLFLYSARDGQQSVEPVSVNIGSDAESAIRRAKTQQCRNELIEFARRNRVEDQKITYFNRTCPLDSKILQRVIRLGCSNHTTPSNDHSHYVMLEDNQASDSDSCNDLCFSFGHAYASYNLKTGKCYCFDRKLENIQNLNPCASTESQLEWTQVNNGIHPSNTKKFLQSDRNVDKTALRIAYLMSLNGRSILQVRRLLKSIYSQRHIYYIHVDKREHYLYEKLKPLQREFANIYFSSRRHETIWGGTALLHMIIDAMGDLDHLDWDYLINLSESDFPIKDLSELEAYLVRHSLNSIYLKSHNAKGYDFVKKQGLIHNFYQCEGHVWRLGKRHLPRGLIYSGGSDWFALPREFCHHIVENRNNRGSLVNSLLGIFNFTLLPAESFFHTLAQNGKFCNRLVDNNLRVTNWQRKQGCKCQHENIVDWCGCSPSIYRWRDVDRLRQLANKQSLFFSRKFDPTVSNSVIGFVEAHLVNRLTVPTHIATRYWLNIFQATSDTLPKILIEFGNFATSQAHIKATVSMSLNSVDSYFNHDRFVGLIFKYGHPENLSTEYLVSPKREAHLSRVDQGCFRPNLQLKSIQVNQDFDTGEQIFRSRSPLSSMSNIMVHHEWIVQMNRSDNAMPKPSDVQFKWINPDDEIELVQDAKLKMSTQPSQLSLVHRLHKRKPLPPGLWKLILLSDGRKCLEYRFLIFDETSFARNIPTRIQFNQFYQVTQGCSKSGIADDQAHNSCQFEWSSNSKNSSFSQYCL